MVSFRTRESTYTNNHVKALQEVRISENLNRASKDKVRDFIEKRIAEFGGRWQDDSPLPTMIFERPADADRFAKEINLRLNIPSQHIAVRAWK